MSPHSKNSQFTDAIITWPYLGQEVRRVQILFVQLERKFSTAAFHWLDGAERSTGCAVYCVQCHSCATDKAVVCMPWRKMGRGMSKVHLANHLKQPTQSFSSRGKVLHHRKFTLLPSLVQLHNNLYVQLGQYADPILPDTYNFAHPADLWSPRNTVKNATHNPLWSNGPMEGQVQKLLARKLLSSATWAFNARIMKTCLTWVQKVLQAHNNSFQQ